MSDREPGAGDDRGSASKPSPSGSDHSSSESNQSNTESDRSEPESDPSRPGSRSRDCEWVLLDTSALMLPVQADVRVFEELDRLVPGAEPVVPESVLAELEALAQGGGTEGTAAGVGRDLADRCVVVAATATYADDAAVELAAEGRVDYVVTADRGLAERVRSRGVPVIGLSGGNELALNRP